MYKAIERVSPVSGNPVTRERKGELYTYRERYRDRAWPERRVPSDGGPGERVRQGEMAERVLREGPSEGGPERGNINR